MVLQIGKDKAVNHPTDPGAALDLVIFGATGDLACRKLLPALLRSLIGGRLAPSMRIIGVAIDAIATSEYRQSVQRSLPGGVAGPREIDAFLRRIDYLRLDVTESAGWEALTSLLRATGGYRQCVFYLATAPALFAPLCMRLAEQGLNEGAARIVLEKPLGQDLVSAMAINDAVGSVFCESSIFRIDHYLGKEAVQNLTALRFGNTLFEPVWNSSQIDHVQITVAETCGIEGRGSYYAQAGALRDMVQNHLLQLLCLVAMESPVALDGDAMRDEKLKVLRALEPLYGVRANECSVRGRYRYESSGDDSRPASCGSQPVSGVETFVALKVGLANRRWHGTPFYLRTGKCMAARLSEIVVVFRPGSRAIYPGACDASSGNRLVLRLQPDEGVKLWLSLKEPGPDGQRLRRVPLDLSFAEAFGREAPDAYERLLMDVVRGNPMLFMRRDEVEAAWSWIDGIVDGWLTGDLRPCPYVAGSWGPESATGMIERDRRLWHEDWMRLTCIEREEAVLG